MKNTHIQNLDEIIPADIRLQTYKETLEYLEIGENRNNWGEVFPELGRDINKILGCRLKKSDKIDMRKRLLRLWIKELSDD